MGSIYKRGNVYWIAYVDRRGQQHCESSRLKGVRPGSNFNDAKRLLAEREGKIADGVPVTPDTSKFSFPDAAQLVIDNYIRKERRSITDMQRRLDKHLSPHFGTLRMTEITSDVIDAFVAARKKAGASNGEINRELAILKRAFTLSMRAHKVHARPYIEMLPEAAPRSGFFDHDAFDKVCKNLPAEVVPLARFCYITGWRWKSEVRPLTWDLVDFNSGTVMVEPSKTKEVEPTRVFAMTSELRKLLQAQRVYTDALEARTDRKCPLVFHRQGEPIHWFYDSWRNACEAAGVPGRYLHDLRRTAIRNLVRAGVSEGVAMKMCGHKTRAIFDRYNVTSEKDIHSAAARLSAHHKELTRQARDRDKRARGKKRPSATRAARAS